MASLTLHNEKVYIYVQMRRTEMNTDGLSDKIRWIQNIAFWKPQGLYIMKQVSLIKRAPGGMELGDVISQICNRVLWLAYMVFAINCNK